jgi:hypothetical protein
VTVRGLGHRGPPARADLRAPWMHLRGIGWMSWLACAC